jgi:hypothetical protein
MKSYYLLAPLAAALVTGCAVTTPVATVPTAVVTPPSTVVLGAAPVTVIDSDGDGVPDNMDRYPLHPQWR